ncbi:MAG: MauE/DoxX family redox-associated membrane protein [Tepidisphaeraceae bacterium]
MFTRGATVMSVILSLVFVYAQARARFEGLSVDCGCFGNSATGASLGSWSLVRAIGLLIMANVGCLAFFVACQQGTLSGRDSK